GGGVDLLGSFNERYRQKSRRPTPKILAPLLTNMSALFERMYIIIDGLNECSSIERETLLSSLKGTLGVNMSLLITSRFERAIDMCFLRESAVTTSIRISTEHVTADITMSIDWNLAQ